MFDNKRILILGGTGSFGKAFTFYLLEKYPSLKRIVVFSRDEQKQYELALSLPEESKSKVQFIIGDVRDKNRLSEAFHKIDIVIHAAAMKHVPIAELNPSECFKTNIEGTQNVIDLAIEQKVESVVALSTDKAVLPINVYGASKLFLEKLIVSGNNNPKNEGTKLSVVRYANVLGSRGSVVPFFLKEKHRGVLPITDLNMTRFSITFQDSINVVLYALQHMLGGEVFVPKAPSYTIKTVATAIGPECILEEKGIRNGEKLSELMFSKQESPRTIEMKHCYVVLPESGRFDVKEYISKKGGVKVPDGFEYDSATNSVWLTVEDLRSQIELLNL